MQSLIRGSAMLYTNGLSISNLSKSLTYLGSGMIGVVPVPALLFIIILLIGYFVATKTSYGRYVYAIGGNREATRLSGINTDLVRICSFAVSGFLAGLAGLVLMGRVSSGQPTAASGWELNAIAAVVIGGTSMYGGRGSMFGTLIGALFLTVINNGLDITGNSHRYPDYLRSGCRQRKKNRLIHMINRRVCNSGFPGTP
jgi:ribose/xylose/arabinose/galactoside ABC-type transport system permease subunit